MFKKVLIANRGEIAVRIIRACREMGIATVAVYSEADSEALHTELADEAICIGPARASDSYLNEQQILSAALVTNSEAIHPGFGFLSENSRFAFMCEECGIKFIGPKSKTIDEMGNKVNARKIMQAAGVPVIPGSDGGISSVDEALKLADEIGYPVMLKAAAGGGGKGIRKVFSKEELPKEFNASQQEAKAAFSSDEMYMEKIIYPARHIEVQILGDSFGNVIQLGERDCSLQRNNQKLIEEAPYDELSEDNRKYLGKIAVQAGKSVDYESAGTIEFLMDKSGNFYFMEMNTRIQVEHAVTEMVTGIDIVNEQLIVASGEKLSVSQDDVKLSGHAIECRINAENPKLNFAPSPGKIENLFLPSGNLGLRVESAVYDGYEIPPFYDSMIAKIIVHGKDRKQALMKMNRALDEVVTDGLVTNVDFQRALLNHKKVTSGDYDTAFVQEEFLPTWKI